MGSSSEIEKERDQIQGVRISYSGCNDVKDRKETYGLITAGMVAMAKRKERVSGQGGL